MPMAAVCRTSLWTSPSSLAVARSSGAPLEQNGAGIATATWRMGTLAGREQRVVASVLDTLTGALIDTAHFTATAAAGPPATLFAISGSGQVVGLGQPLPAPLRVLVQDAHGNPTPGVLVSWVVVSGTATLSTALTAADAQGVASNTLTVGQTESDIEGVAISPNGSTLYTADDSNGEIVFVNRGTGTVTTRLSAPGAWGVALSPDGNTLFVTTNYGYIVVVDVPSATITKRYWADSQPREIFVMPDNRTAMSANIGGWIDVVTK
jgi:DNA-binding beta-propeller fold protein YncE